MSRTGTARGRPPGLVGISGWIDSHWSSVRSDGYGVRLIPRPYPDPAHAVHTSLQTGSESGLQPHAVQTATFLVPFPLVGEG